MHILLTLAVAGGEWSVSRLSWLTPRERNTGTHWKRDWVDPRALYPIQKDGHCYGNLKSSFLVSPAWENDPSAATRPSHNLFSVFTSTINRVLVGMVFLGNETFSHL
jgi:hypothetical protein